MRKAYLTNDQFSAADLAAGVNFPHEQRTYLSTFVHSPPFISLYELFRKLKRANRYTYSFLVTVGYIASLLHTTREDRVTTSRERRSKKGLLNGLKKVQRPEW